MKTTLRPTILTVSGQSFNFIDPASNVIRVTDIAHALAHVCRFTGRARGFSFVLLGWAANARRRAMATKPALPVQGDLFGGAA